MKERNNWSLRNFSLSVDDSWKKSHWREGIRVHKVWQELLRIKILKVPSEDPWRKEIIEVSGAFPHQVTQEDLWNHSSSQYVTGTSPHFEVEIHKRTNMEQNPKWDIEARWALLPVDSYLYWIHICDYHSQITKNQNRTPVGSHSIENKT